MKTKTYIISLVVLAQDHVFLHSMHAHARAALNRLQDEGWDSDGIVWLLTGDKSFQDGLESVVELARQTCRPMQISKLELEL